MPRLGNRPVELLAQRRRIMIEDIGPGLLGQHVDDDRFAVDACGGRLLIFTQAKIIAARLRQVFRHSDYPFKSRPPRRDPVSNNFSPPCRYLAIKSRSEEHPSELQSLMRISYAVFCLKKKTTRSPHN